MTQITPVTDYLKRCADNHPADSALLGSLAAVYLGAESRLHAHILRKALISAVARAMSPGCEVQSACVLVARSGIEGSKFWHCLAGHWYGRIAHSIGKDPLCTKGELLQVNQSWIVEWEAVGLMVTGKQDLLPAQGLIVAPVSTFRPPFESRARQFSRPSIIVGTANLGDFDELPSSSPRLRVIPVTQDIPLARLKAERDRIWAAAYHAYIDGEGWTT